MLIFKRPTTPHTRVATHRMLSAIRPVELSHGTAKSCRIADPKQADQHPKYREHEDPTALRLNRLLEAPSINAESLPRARERTMTKSAASAKNRPSPLPVTRAFQTARRNQNSAVDNR